MTSVKLIIFPIESKNNLVRCYFLSSLEPPVKVIKNFTEPINGFCLLLVYNLNMINVKITQH